MNRIKLYTALIVICCIECTSQPANLIANGGFEDILNCTPINWVSRWSRIDTTKAAYIIYNTCIGNVPGGTLSDFQSPHSGEGFLGGTMYCTTCTSTLNRTYYRTTLTNALNNGTKYCLKFFVNVRNFSPCGVDGVGAHLADITLDTIKYGEIPLSYLTPQVSNSNGNIIVDTLNWIPISGTLAANGNEKYLVLGNFKSNQATNSAPISTQTPCYGSDFLFDDVSLIEMDLPAFAGNDTAMVPGDSAFIGRTPDVGIDEACQWFKLPNMTTAFDTVAGLWVKPVNTTTYVVRQQLWCSGVKWDTVVIHMNPVSLHEKIKWLNEQLKIFPVPADDQIVLMLPDIVLAEDVRSLKIYDHFGQMIREREVRFESKTVTVDVALLKEGIYTVQLNGEKAGTVQKKFVIRR